VTATCSACGRAAVPGGRFCRGCGQPLGAVSPDEPNPPAQRTCASCGTTLVADARFCHHCGGAAGGAQSGSAEREEPKTVVLRRPLSAAAHEVAADVAGTTLPRSPEQAFAPARSAPRSDEIVTLVSSDPDAESPTNTPACPSCGSCVSGTGRFCRACGTPLSAPAPAVRTEQVGVAVTCSSCHGQVEDWAPFCRHCGSSLTNRDGAGHGRAMPGSGRPCEVCGAQVGGPGGMCRDCETAVAS
jgi:predicted amidophosphoribosyltransferase